MKINLSPVASNHTTSIFLNGLVLTIDEIEVDLSVIPDGGLAEPEDDSIFLGSVSRDEVTIKYHYESTKAEPKQSTDWADYTFEVTNGEVPCPIVWKEGANV